MHSKAHFSHSGPAFPKRAAAMLPAKISALVLRGTGIFLWLLTWMKYSLTLFSRSHFRAPSVSLKVSSSSDLSSKPSVSLSAESESLTKIMEQFAIFLFLSETKRVFIAKSSSVVLEVFSVTVISETCVP